MKKLSIVFEETGGESQGKLAREFGVTQPAISLIVNGRNWRHVA